MKLLTHYRETHKPARAEIINWRENYINDSLYYSYRSTQYDRNTYPSRLHYHDYYELVIFESGDIHYICEGQVCRPVCGDTILIPPGNLHMSMISADTTCYKRHVFYLYPDAFDAMGCGVLAGFLQAKSRMTVMSPDPAVWRQLDMLLSRLEEMLSYTGDPLSRALGLSYIVQIFYHLNRSKLRPSPEVPQIPKSVAEIARYLDEHYAKVSSVEQVAKQFFYSREYVSRLFKHCFNTTVTEYIRTRRIAHSQKLIAQGIPLVEVSAACGYDNLSTFNRAFRAVTGTTPSAYRKEHRSKP